MADNTTVVNIKEMAVLKMKFEKDGQEYHITESFSIMSLQGGNQIIIGLPTIVHKLSNLFQGMLEDAVSNLCTLDEFSAERAFKGMCEESPEELETPLPCAFETFLHFTNISQTEAVQNYESLFAEHVATDFAEHTQVLNLLKTKGAKVFIPQNWDGIRGIELLELQFKSEVPKSETSEPEVIRTSQVGI